uniref:Uncharacterized protein n=1 Tax=Peronospora matthiolae TaxID=2874970 RepID=A0AAV1V1X7_9STRA
MRAIPDGTWASQVNTDVESGKYFMDEVEHKAVEKR